MSRRQKEPLRAVRGEEQAGLSRLTRSTEQPANHVLRAKQLLAGSAGQSYTQAARRTGRRSGDAVAQLVRRFNREGQPAVERRSGGGAKRRYGVADRAAIVATARWYPTPARDGTATWSLTLLPHRHAPQAVRAGEHVHAVGGVAGGRLKVGPHAELV